jgi:hypothetical protein
MRRIFFLLLATLPAPAAALAAVSTAGDGSLVVSSASARLLDLQGSGLIFGHITQGTLTIVEYAPADSGTVEVSGAMTKVSSGTTTRYTGADLRFLLPNGRYVLRLDGLGIDVSAVGKGQVTAVGMGTSEDGELAANGAKAVPVGLSPTSLSFGASRAPSAALAPARSSQH